MRTKKRPPVAAPALNAAWSAFFAQAAIHDADELRAAGWLTNAEIASESKLSRTAGLQLADAGVRDGILEKAVFKVMMQGRRKNVNFYRPK
jgi:hypothetical protein